MQCPKCDATMTPVAYQSSTVHRCKNCAGLWFEPVEHERLKDLAEQIDTCDASVVRITTASTGSIVPSAPTGR